MIDQVKFLHADWLWVVVPLAALLLIIFLVKEWKSGQRWGWLRSIVASLSIACLMTIALRPALHEETDSRYGVVLSKRYSQATLDSLKELYDPKVFMYDPEADLFRSGTDFHSVFVLGEGIAPFDLWQFDYLSAIYTPGRKPTGIVKLKYPHETTVGEQLTVKGLYRNDKGGKEIFLEASEGYPLDSAIIGETETGFALNADVKAPGRFLYYLTVKDTLGRIISRDPVPVVVRDEIPLSILIINAYPTFETKYLKNFLSENGHAVLVRNQVSKARFRYENYNRPASRLDRLTLGLLSDFDLVVMDHSSVQQLSPRESGVIEEAIRKEGLGLFIQSGELMYTSGVPWVSFDFAADKENETILEGQRIAKYPFVIREGFLQQTPFAGNTGAVTAFQQVGVGKVGTTVLSDTYTLLLKGEGAVYQQLWTNIIEAHAKAITNKNEWKGLHPVAFAGQPHQFQLRSREPQPKVIADSLSIPMAEDIDVPGLWHGTIWPEQPGWHQMASLSDSLGGYDYYVVDTAHWQGLVAEQTTMANKRYFSRATAPSVTKNNNWQPVNLIYFYLLFILGVGYLWLAPKL